MGKTNRTNKKDKTVNSRTSMNFVLICAIHWDMFFLNFTGSSNSTKDWLDFVLGRYPCVFAHSAFFVLAQTIVYCLVRFHLTLVLFICIFRDEFEAAWCVGTLQIWNLDWKNWVIFNWQLLITSPLFSFLPYQICISIAFLESHKWQRSSESHTRRMKRS